MLATMLSIHVHREMSFTQCIQCYYRLNRLYGLCGATPNRCEAERSFPPPPLEEGSKGTSYRGVRGARGP